MSDFTPGPWVFDGRDTIKAPDGDLLLLTGIRVPMVAGADREESRANAHLIAAAPAMYKELKECAAIFRRYEEMHLEKKTGVGELKAAANADVAERIESILAQADGKS